MIHAVISPKSHQDGLTTGTDDDRIVKKMLQIGLWFSHIFGKLHRFLPNRMGRSPQNVKKSTPLQIPCCVLIVIYIRNPSGSRLILIVQGAEIIWNCSGPFNFIYFSVICIWVKLWYKLKIQLISQLSNLCFVSRYLTIIQWALVE